MHCKIALFPKSALDLLWYIARGKAAAVESMEHVYAISKVLTVIYASEFVFTFVAYTNHWHSELLNNPSQVFLYACSILHKRTSFFLRLYWRSENEDFLKERPKKLS